MASISHKMTLTKPWLKPLFNLTLYYPMVITVSPVQKCRLWIKKKEQGRLPVRALSKEWKSTWRRIKKLAQLKVDLTPKLVSNMKNSNSAPSNLIQKEF